MRRLVALLAVLLVAVPATAHAAPTYTYDASGIKRADRVVVWCYDFQSTDQGSFDVLWSSNWIPLTGSFTPLVGGTNYGDDGPAATVVTCRVTALTKNNRVAQTFMEVTY